MNRIKDSSINELLELKSLVNELNSSVEKYSHIRNRIPKKLIEKIEIINSEINHELIQRNETFSKIDDPLLILDSFKNEILEILNDGSKLRAVAYLVNFAKKNDINLSLKDAKDYCDKLAYDNKKN